MTSIRASDLVAERVRRLRGGRGWTVRQLAERCKEVGAPELSAAVIANIESGRRDKETGQRRRDVTIDEVLALALALDAPPLLFCMPYNGWDYLKITSRVDAPTLLALDWITGEGLPAPLGDVAEWMKAVHPLTLYRQFQSARAKVSRWLMTFNFEVPPGIELEDTPFAELAGTLNAMIGAGVDPPPLPRMWVDAMRPLLKSPDLVTVAEGEADDGAR